MTASRQRLLALGLLFLAAGFTWLLIVQPIADAFAAQGEAIAGSHRLLAAYERRIALRPVVEARLAELKNRESSAAGLIDGASAELAAANIQNRIKALIEGESGQIRSAQNLPPVTEAGFQRIDIQYDVSLPMTRLKSVAYRIESGAPYLFLGGVDLHAPENWESYGAPGTPPNLDVRWTVRAYRWMGPR
ncbi:MAG TPA: type II secretion system protein GspM [Rhizomicrobium sp.]